MTESYEADFLQQKRTIVLMQNFVSNTTKRQKEAAFTEVDCQLRLDLLEKYWASFEKIDIRLSPISKSKKERMYFKEDLYNEGSTCYLEAKGWLKNKLQTLVAPPAGATGTRSANSTQAAAICSVQSQLEKVKIPRFDEKQRSWETFKEKFKSLVLNDAGMPVVIKFQHLLNSLEGEAADKLKGIEIIGANFQTAWDTLTRRYDNRFLRFSTHMQALTSLSSATQVSGSHLSKLLNTTNESVNTLRALGLPVKQWDVVLIHFIECKLDPATRLYWIKELEKMKDEQADTFPTFESFQTFLEDRIRSLMRRRKGEKSAVHLRQSAIERRI
ncbi:hypothetical protein TSAR_012719 [Trichomalopsis sarcophagae]|uniref:Uncharacterized protein n=1 Tax=Trichomalopsis sarcophagae TaxID=543379 RepID=A0A232FHF1_9HYME|nr:hypothetical protein TSAR_012719 [Trichomalopsis sarcophagae]